MSAISTKVARTITQADLDTNRFVVLATYRHLLRATRIAFQGDKDTLIASRNFARDSFRAGAAVQLGSTEAQGRVDHAQGVTKILRENVVQGKKVEGSGKEEQRYKLNIHEHTERGDNETAGKLKGTTKSFREVKDATF